MQTYQVETGDVLISDAIIAIAKANEFSAPYSRLFESGTHRPYLVIDGAGDLDWNQHACDDRHQTITVPEFIELLKPKPEPPIRIGEHYVEFMDGGIKVGCLFVTTETVDKIHAKLHERSGLSETDIAPQGRPR